MIRLRSLKLVEGRINRLYLSASAAKNIDGTMEGSAGKTALLEKRTEGIMDANRRNYYGECAAYIAALGEARESMEEMGAKQGLMTSYKDKYLRRRAFREELRNYGWIDTKRK